MIAGLDEAADTPCCNGDGDKLSAGDADELSACDRVPSAIADVSASLRCAPAGSTAGAAGQDVAATAAAGREAVPRAVATLAAAGSDLAVAASAWTRNGGAVLAAGRPIVGSAPYEGGVSMTGGTATVGPDPVATISGSVA